MKKGIIISGPPYSGKDTQSYALAERFSGRNIPTGKLLRDAVQEGTEYGQIASKYMDRGILVPGETINAIIRPFIENSLHTLLFFNGYPRGPEHLPGFIKMTESLGITIAAVFALRVPKEELLSRYAKINPFVYRSDEKKMEVVEQRIRVFDEETEEVLKYYQSVKTSVFDIDGKQTPDLVTKNIAAYLYDIL